MDSERRLTIALIGEETGISVGTVHTIVTEDLAMRKLCAKLVPKVLSEEQKPSRVEISQKLLECVQEDEDFLDIITDDESWVFQYDPETNPQRSEWHTQVSPRPNKEKSSDVKIKTILIVFFFLTDFSLFTRSLCPLEIP